ncbi:MAG TPA: decaprenyl-phosphate phosphoribosyltransferase [Thermomicrobiales bacterium]|nr:decaprenyl-phosphate phosphoribosyltransferase [Thermomicrobiales bacterium]
MVRNTIATPEGTAEPGEPARTAAARARRPLPLAMLAALRPRQWTKNAIVFAALVFARRVFDPPALAEAVAAFVFFCAVSGAIYLVNDILDVEQDRMHPRKRFRPIAAGELPVGLAWALAGVLAGGSLALAALLRPALAGVIGVYVIVQVAYSLVLKHQVILDVFAIAAGFVLRAAAGAVAIGVPISPWLYVCTVLLALFLGLAKRRAEIMLLNEEAGRHRRILEEYSATLLEEMIAVVTSATVMAYALYTFSAENLPRDHSMMLTIPFVLYAIFRYLYLVYRKNEGGSPEQLLLTDVPLLACIVLWGLASIVLLYSPWR